MTLIEQYRTWLAEEKPKGKFSQAVDDLASKVRSRLSGSDYVRKVAVAAKGTPSAEEFKTGGNPRRTSNRINAKARRIGFPT